MNPKFKAPRKTKRTKALSTVQRKQVLNIVKGSAETKLVAWYSSSLFDGEFSTSGIVPQNGSIVTNATDILRIVPKIKQGTDDNERIGQDVVPVSCKVNCKVLLTPTLASGVGTNQGYSYNLMAVAYCLQHVALKTYTALAANNNFTQMLKIGNGNTTNFAPQFQYGTLPVEDGYYKVLAKKKMVLRSSGIIGASPIPQNVGTNNNSHQICHEWTWDITKHLPKKLKFPETTAVAPTDDPTNAAPFWCVGYYTLDGLPVGSGAPVQLFQQYASFLYFKDQ